MNYVMSDPRGREFVYRLLATYGIYRSVALYHPHGIRPEERLLYNGAQQDVAQQIRSEALACDQIGRLYLTMLSEAEAERVRLELEARKKEADKVRRNKENQDDGSSDGSDPSSGDPGGSA